MKHAIHILHQAERPVQHRKMGGSVSALILTIIVAAVIGAIVAKLGGHEFRRYVRTKTVLIDPQENTP